MGHDTRSRRPQKRRIRRGIRLGSVSSGFGMTDVQRRRAQSVVRRALARHR